MSTKGGYTAPEPSRPAAPESETPETDAALKSVEEHSHAHSLIRCANVADVARSLERRLSLAQTEIKGHMRVKDDLRAELREANEAAIRWYRAASPYATPVALREALDRLKDHA